MKPFFTIAAAFLSLAVNASATDDARNQGLSVADSLDTGSAVVDSPAFGVSSLQDSLPVQETARETAATRPHKHGKGVWDRKKFLNIAYSMQTLSPDFGNAAEGTFAAALASGRSIYLHRNPIAGLVKFSLDFGTDINYAQYMPLEGDYNMDNEISDMIGISGRHHLDIGLFLGPAVSVNPVGKLMVKGYFRFVPSYSVLMLESDIYHGFAPNFTYGGEICWNWIGLGIEGRSGFGTYSSLISLIEGSESMPAGYGTEALRVYICFRF